MFIKLFTSSHIFLVFRAQDIISINPCFFAEDCFEKYQLLLSNQEESIDLTWSQGQRLLSLLEPQAILFDDTDTPEFVQASIRQESK